MLIKVGYDIGFTVSQPTPLITLLDIHPDRRSDIVWEIPMSFDPVLPSQTHTDQFGNIAQRILVPAGTWKITYRAMVHDTGLADRRCVAAPDVSIHDVPPVCLPYLKPSRYCESDKMSELAWALFGGYASSCARVAAIVAFVHGHLRFDYQQARATRTASEAFEERVGVCRDFAHLTIALARALNIPARYVNGYLGDIGVPADPAPMDFSAWCEVFLNGEWYVVDARHFVPRAGRIAISRGLDAADAAMLTTFGAHQLDLFRVTAEEDAPLAFTRAA